MEIKWGQSGTLRMLGREGSSSRDLKFGRVITACGTPQPDFDWGKYFAEGRGWRLF